MIQSPGTRRRGEGLFWRPQYDGWISTVNDCEIICGHACKIISGAIGFPSAFASQSLQPPGINNVIRGQRFPTSPPVDFENRVKQPRPFESEQPVADPLKTSVIPGYSTSGWNRGCNGIIFSFTRFIKSPIFIVRVRIWWNWQTRYFEVVVPQGMQVQVLLCAPLFLRKLRVSLTTAQIWGESSGPKMKFPKVIRHRKAEVTIYGKKKNYQCYRIACRQLGGGIFVISPNTAKRYSRRKSRLANWLKGLNVMSSDPGCARDTEVNNEINNKTPVGVTHDAFIHSRN
jgi:hypothetical protein